MSHKLQDLGRREINFRNRNVKEVLPEYFTSDYPNLVKFLEYYYDYLDSDGVDAFDTEIRQLNVVRDLGETPTEYLNFLISEISDGLPNGDLFTDPRKSARQFGDLYRNKGSRSVIEGFFRGFFQQEMVVEYPKNNIFIVGESKIGYDSLKFIQDYGRYQIYSILVKVALGTSQYETLYKKYAHPAGWYFEGEVVIEGEADLSVNPITVSIPDVAPIGSLVSEASISIAPFVSMTGLVDSNSQAVRFDLNKTIAFYQTITSTQLTGFYDDIIEQVNPNSFTFDDSATISPDLSITIETLDNNMFTRYLSDSTY